MNELIARSVAKKQKLSSAELQDASNQVKANLVVTLQKIVAKLASEPPDSIDLSKFSRLVETSARLFAWPATKAVEISTSNESPFKQLNTAINLALIRTTPEQLRAKARLMASSDDEKQEKIAS
jgi:hypothetical protein